MSRVAAAGVLLLCAAVAIYCLILIFVGAPYVGCTTSTPPAPTDDCRTHLVPIPQAVVPLGLTLLVAIPLILRRTSVALFLTLPLLGFGFLGGLSIGGPIFLAAALMIVLLVIRYASLPRATA